MSVIEDILEPGADFHRAKRNAFIASLLGLALSSAQHAKDGNAALTVFNVVLDRPLWVFVFIAALAILYNGYNFYVQERRAFFAHSKLVRQFDAVSLEAALEKLGIALNEVERTATEALNSVKRGTLPFPHTSMDDLSDVWAPQASMRVLEEAKQFRGTGFSMLDDYTIKQFQAAPYQHIKARDEAHYRAMDLALDKLTKAIRHDIDVGANGIVGDWQRSLEERLQALDAASRSFIPQTHNALIKMTHDLRSISTDITPREKRFFKVDKWIVYGSLALAFVVCIARLGQDLAVLVGPRMAQMPFLCCIA